MRRILVPFVGPHLSCSVPEAAAQTCTGMPSFSAGQMQVTAGGSFADGTSSFGGTFGYGLPKSLYGKAGLGTTSYDGLDGSSFDFGVAAATRSRSSPRGRPSCARSPA